jgi:protein phosphatase
MKINSVGKTDKGQIREVNEDSYAILARKGIFAVSDGVGGHNRGDMASSKAMEVMKSYVSKNPIDDSDLEAYFAAMVTELDKSISSLAQENVEYEGMATTVTIAYIRNKKFFIANIGDSRAYLITEKDIMKITDDHSYVNELVKTGDITEEEARLHPRKNIITKAIGLGENPAPDFYVGDFLVGDKLLLCTDGLTNEILNESIFFIVNKNKRLETAATNLVRQANENGGLDNITVVLIESMEEENGE